MSGNEEQLKKVKDELATEEIYDLVLEDIPVKVKGSDGVVRIFKMREADGTVRDAYMKDMMARMERGADGKPNGVMKSVDGMHAFLLSRTMYDEHGKPVTEQMIQGWPSRVQSALFLKSQLHSQLRDKDVDEAKKD